MVAILASVALVAAAVAAKVMAVVVQAMVNSNSNIKLHFIPISSIILLQINPFICYNACYRYISNFHICKCLSHLILMIDRRWGRQF